MTAEQRIKDLEEALRLATGDTGEAWQAWVHEQGCRYEEPFEETCTCDGLYIVNEVKRLLGKT